ncbi:FXYD domain-containing ion transport regulator 5 isoform X5 [Macaca fascicularis]|uniref:FXYD domain-containing ion transport regulator 5 isoform X5 n=1 Tax=Macaca fascicularis TaxID=9541 RepID=UPI003D1547E0
MSPFGRLCLLTIVGLILPTRGQTLKYTTPISSADPTIMDIQVPTPAPETPQPQTQTQTQRPTGVDGPLVTDPETHKSTKTGFHEDDPFFYDEHTLRKRGLLVAAVLFITGIIILTSGKCRQLSGLCRNYCR